MPSKMKKVLLISMPFGALDRQALGLSLLKAQLKRERIKCDIRYLNFVFAEMIGGEEYFYISSELPHSAFAGEWIFSAALYGQDDIRDNKYINRVLQNTWHLDHAVINRILRARTFVAHFFNYCMAIERFEDYDIIGFTSTFEQNIASLALAKIIKKTYPAIKTVFGGGNWEDEMGLELHRRFKFVDFVCPGEADESFPALVKSILRDGAGRRSLKKINGLIYRSNGESIYTGPPVLIRDMDKLPYPDYSDFFSDFDNSAAASFIVPSLLFEGARGCWWGARSHCTFCGLNGNTLMFRPKAAERAINEIMYLANKWKIDLVQAVDNILSKDYFDNMLPSLAESKFPIRMFYEVKANLSRKNVETLYNAGVNHIQPGIESLSDRILRLMRKGTTALQNIQLLKWCNEYGIKADWNILYGFPGENRDDYVEILKYLRAIRFFNPPPMCGKVRLDRFSEYFKFPRLFGLKNIRPLESYRYIYPFNSDVISKIAYYFDYDYEPSVDPSGAAEEVIRFVDEWRKYPEKGSLKSVRKANGRLALLDKRSDSLVSEAILEDLDSKLYEYCDRAHTLNAIIKYLGQEFAGCNFSREEIREKLNFFINRRWMVSDGRRFLSLALRSASVKGKNEIEPVKFEKACDL